MGGSLKPLAPKRKESQNRKPPTKKGRFFYFSRMTQSIPSFYNHISPCRDNFGSVA
jgi:hypothetical protein